ncbi:hypothetical protein [Aliarcobacter cryaerophilus]|uniref:hypothetical protein n=1 Tax=Aliarcobacter cryaerophilus TaxID=28198 RepID=UPI003DA2E08F
MKSLYSQLSILKDDESLFLNFKKNQTIKQIQKELNITINEVIVLSISNHINITKTYQKV